MVDPQQYIKEGLKIVAGLMKQGNLQGALQNCQELLKVNPYDHDVQKFLQKIQEEILKDNEKKVDADIDATMHFWKEGRYDELAKIYTKLYPYAPQYRRLQKLLQQLQEKLTNQQKSERLEFTKRALEAIKGLLKEKKYEDAMKACKELLSINPLDTDAKLYLKKATDQFIEQKLQENQRVVEGTDFERSLDFYESLLKIDPNHQHVKELAFLAKAHTGEQKALAGKIHLNESIVRMKNLFAKAEYEMVVQAAEEIDRLEPGNFSAKVFKKKATETMRKESNRLIVKKLRETFAALKPEYQKNPGAFVVI